MRLAPSTMPKPVARRAPFRTPYGMVPLPASQGRIRNRTLLSSLAAQRRGRGTARERGGGGKPPMNAPLQAPPLPTLRLLTCGSVDDGKSTLIGRLLYEQKLILDDQLSALERDSKKFGTTGDDIDYALLVDGLEAEREQGITIDVAYRYFATARRSFIVAEMRKATTSERQGRLIDADEASSMEKKKREGYF